MVKAAKGLICYKKGLFCFDCEMYQEAQIEFNRSLTLFNSLSEAYKLKFLNLFQDIFNSLGIMEC